MGDRQQRGEPSSLSLYRWSSAWSHFLTQATLVPHGVLEVDVWLDACVLKPLLGYWVDFGSGPVPLLSLIPTVSLGVMRLPWQIVHYLALSTT